jgi:hypothetical protein
MSSNYSLFSIPLYWIIALWPHGHAASPLLTTNPRITKLTQMLGQTDLSRQQQILEQQEPARR